MMWAIDHFEVHDIFSRQVFTNVPDQIYVEIKSANEECFSFYQFALAISASSRFGSTIRLGYCLHRLTASFPYQNSIDVGISME